MNFDWCLGEYLPCRKRAWLMSMNYKRNYYFMFGINMQSVFSRLALTFFLIESWPQSSNKYCKKTAYINICGIQRKVATSMKQYFKVPVNNISKFQINFFDWCTSIPDNLILKSVSDRAVFYKCQAIKRYCSSQPSGLVRSWYFEK